MFINDLLTKIDRWRLHRMQDREESESKLFPLRMKKIEQEIRYTELKTQIKEAQSESI